MAIDKLIPQYLNKDEDARLIKNVEMSNALNVRVSNDPEGNQGVLKNVKGNTSISANAKDLIPDSGSNRVIGSVSSEAGKCIYYFLYNTGGLHGIYVYRYTADQYYMVYENSVLNFGAQDHVKADVVINQFGEHLLYFTDNRNEPRKINATRALQSNYSAVLQTGSTAEKELFLTVCKQPPQTPITFEFLTEDNNKSNKLKNNIFQFAYQYVYDDGETSALSMYSKIAVSTTNLAHNITSKTFFEDENNAVELTLAATKAPVDKIRIYARKNNDQAFYRIGEVDNTPEGGTVGFTFRNDGVYNLLPDQEAFKLFDAVPRKAFSQAVSNNRLFYSNYLEGFDNINTDGNITYPVYHPTPFNLDLPSQAGAVESGTFTEFVQNYYDFILGNRIGTNEPSTLTASDNLVSYGQFDGYPGIEIDISQVVDMENIQPGQINFLAKFDFTEFGIGTFGNDNNHFDYPVTFTDENGDPPQALLDANLPTSLNMQVLTPQFSGLNFGFNNSQGNAVISQAAVDNASDDIQASTSISNLQPTAPITFSTSFDVLNEITATDDVSIEQAFANELIDGVNGTATTEFLGVLQTEDEYGDAVPALEGQSIQPLIYSTVAINNVFTTPNVPTVSGTDQLMARMAFEGFVTFELYEGTYFLDGDVPKVRFKIRVTETALNLKKFAFSSYTDSEFSSNELGVINGQYLQHNFSGPILGGAGNTTAIGMELKDDFGDGTNQVVSAYRGFKQTSASIEFINDQSKAFESFKAGATHDLGIVYFDHRNRPSGVQKINSVDVDHFGRSSRSGNEGKSEIDIRLEHEPPSWATKWAPVYSKNTTYESILQISVSEAALAKQTTYADPLAGAGDGTITRPIVEGLAGGTSGLIYLSLRSLEGKNNSYRESKGANISYEYREGDMLRVLECISSDGAKVRPLAEFPITSYKMYGDDENNPIKLTTDSLAPDENAYRRTGFFMTIRDEDVANFTRGNVAAGTDYFSNNCVVEIYRPAKIEENQRYYEIGECYDIVEQGGLRTHGGDRDNFTSSTFNIIVNGLNTFNTSERLYIGDKVLTAGTGSGFFTVNGITINDDGTFTYTTDGGQNNFSQGTQGTGIPNNSVVSTPGNNSGIFAGVVTLSTGDVYLRRRSLLVNVLDSTTGLPDETKPDDQFYKTFFIEDQSASDFFESKAVSIGRPHIETPDQQELRRISSVTYSDVFTLDSATLNLSSFNPSLFPFKDYNTQHGAICYLMDRNEALLVMQENKVSATPISRVLIESAAGGQLVTSQNVMGTPTYYAGDYGPGLQPEGVTERFGRVYFVDVSRAAVLQLDSNGLQPISAKHMDSYFQTKLGLIDSVSATKKVPCGIDPDNDEYIVSMSEISSQMLSVPSDDGGDIIRVESPRMGTGKSYSDLIVNPEYRKNGAPWWNEDADLWQMDSENWERSGNGIAYIDQLPEKGGVVLDTTFDNRATESAVNIKFSLFGDDFTGLGFVSIKDSTMSLPTSLVRTSNAGSVTLTKGSGETTVSAETVAWSTTKQVWLTFYSFVPENYAHLHDRFFSFKDGQIWKHNSNPKHNLFYNSANDSEVTIVSKGNASMVKVYDAMSFEGDTPWTAVVSNSDQTTASMPSTEFTEKENMWYRVVGKDETGGTLNTSHKIVLGQVTAIDGDKITFSSRISNLPFGIGDTLFKLESSSETTLSLTISSVSGRKEVTANTTVAGVAVGDTLMAVSEDKINGDNIRDYYAQIAMKNSTQTAIELYAVNMSYTPSNLHNDK